MMSIREIKEQYSYVSQSTTPVQASVLIGGKRRAMEVGEQIKSACEELLKRTFEAVDKLIGKASSESVGELLQNIILTGGGSQIKGLDAEIERLLTEAGYENPKVRTVGQNYKEFVAKGALKAARQAREDQWQQVIL
jgi:rod shape-determining protein MreB